MLDLRRARATVKDWVRRGATYENWLLLILSLTWGFVFFDRMAATFLSPFLVKDLALSNTQLGLLSSGLSIAWAVSSYGISRWSDARGLRKPFLLGFTIAFSLCSFLSGLAPNFTVLLISRILMGIAEGPFLPVCLAIMVIESTPARRGINAGFMQTFFSNLIGNAAAPIVLIGLASLFGWRTAFFVAGVPGLICALAIYLWVREPPIPKPSTSTADTEPAPRIGLLQMLNVRNIWLCCAISVFMVTFAVVGATFYPVYFTELRHIAPDDIKWVLSAAGIAGVLGFFGPALSDRFGRRPVMIFFSLSSILAPLGALFFSGTLPLLAALMFLGSLSAGLFPLFMGIIPGESIPRRYAATAMGLVVGVGEIVGGFIAPTLSGWVADRTSLVTPIAITAACSLLSGIFAFFLTETAPSKRRAIDAPTPLAPTPAPIIAAPSSAPVAAQQAPPAAP